MVPKLKTFILFFAMKFQKDSIGYLEELHQEYGDIFYKNIRGYKQYFCGSPVYAEHILSKFQENYRKHPTFVENFEPFLGDNNLLSSNDPVQWKRDREICNSAITPEIFFEKYAQHVTKNCHQAFDDWGKKYASTGIPCPIGHELDILALININDAIFNHIDIDVESLVDHIPKVFRLLVQRSMSATRLPWIFPSKRKRAYEGEVRYMLEVKTKALLSRIKGGKDYDDLLGL